MALYYIEFILQLLLGLASLINTREQVPLAATHAHAITLPPLWFTAEVLHTPVILAVVDLGCLICPEDVVLKLCWYSEVLLPHWCSGLPRFTSLVPLQYLSVLNEWIARLCYTVSHFGFWAIQQSSVSRVGQRVVIDDSFDSSALW